MAGAERTSPKHTQHPVRPHSCTHSTSAHLPVLPWTKRDPAMALFCILGADGELVSCAGGEGPLVFPPTQASTDSPSPPHCWLTDQFHAPFGAHQLKKHSNRRKSKGKKKLQVNFFSHRKPLKIRGGKAGREFHLENGSFSPPEKYATYRVYFFYMSVECDFFGEEPLCINRHEGWDVAVFAGELARSARRQGDASCQERPGKSCIIPLPAFLLLKSGADGTAFLSKKSFVVACYEILETAISSTSIKT